jgi:acyl-CoA thioesterase-1
VKRIRVTFFGDSICVGEGVALHKGWIPRLSERLTQIGRSLDALVTVSNSSVSGETTRQALLRMPYHIMSLPIDVLIIQYGMNDCNRWATEHNMQRVSLASFRANIMEMVERAHHSGVKHVFVHTNHGSKCSREGYDVENARYNSAIRSAVIEYIKVHGNVVNLIDVERTIAHTGTALEQLLLPDGIHLSEKGHDFYFNLTTPSLEKIVRNL